jgi:hypothetical protein
VLGRTAVYSPGRANVLPNFSPQNTRIQPDPTDVSKLPIPGLFVPAAHEPARLESRAMRAPAAVVVSLLLAFAAGCGGDDSDTVGATETKPADDLAAATIDPRCSIVPPVIVKTLERGLKKSGQRSLRFAQSIKSRDFGSVYFVAADVEGKGLGGADDVGVWAMNNLTFGGVVFAVNAVAKELSEFGDGAKFDPKLTMKNEGAELSRRCTESIGR